MRVMVVEDGLEYSQTLERFLSEDFQWIREGSGPAALDRLGLESFDALFLDMRFDRVPPDRLLGDFDRVADQFNGDPLQARQFLEDHQGNYILAAVRDAGFQVPVLLSYDFDGEPRRWARLAERYPPVDYLPDNASPSDISDRLRRLAAQSTDAP